MVTNEQFITAKKQYRQLISHTLKRYYYLGDPQDLQQLGNIALWRALEKFNPNRSSFSAFLFRMIKWQLLNYKRSKPKYLTNKKVTKIRSPRNYEIDLIDTLDILNNQEAAIFKAKFVDGKTLKEIASDQKTYIDRVFNQITTIRRKIEKDLTSC